jgi:hypothetical protein
MRRFVLLAGLVLTVLSTACGKDDPALPPTPDAGETPDGGAAAACLDRPTDLPRPPTDGLPCELLPPGFVPKGN